MKAHRNKYDIRESKKEKTTYIRKLLVELKNKKNKSEIEKATMIILQKQI